MKKWSIVLLVVALLMPIVAAAQHSSKAAETKPTVSKASIVAGKAVFISGQISLDGKTLVSQENDLECDEPERSSGACGANGFGQVPGVPRQKRNSRLLPETCPNGSKVCVE